VPALAAAGSTVPADGDMTPSVPAETKPEGGTGVEAALGPLIATEIGATVTDVDGTSARALAGPIPATPAATRPPMPRRISDRRFQVNWTTSSSAIVAGFVGLEPTKPLDRRLVKGLSTLHFGPCGADDGRWKYIRFRGFPPDKKADSC